VFSSGTSFATDGKVHGRAFGRAISGRTANRTLLARQRGRSLRTTFPRPLKQGSTPFGVHSPLGRPGGLNVQKIKGGVADHSNAGLSAFRRHPFQGLACHLQQGGAEEPGNPVIPASALQLCGKEILQWAAAGGITIDHRVMCRFGLTFGGSSCSILHGSRQVNILKGDIWQAALP